MDPKSQIIKHVHTVETHYLPPTDAESSSDSSPNWLADKNLFWLGVACVIAFVITTHKTPVVINNQATPPIVINNN